MGQTVTTGAMMMCSFGVAPSTLNIIPLNMVNASGKPAATIMDNLPMANVPPFGMCTTPSNPQVAAATAAAFGVLTPVPCVPVLPAPWVPGSPTVMVKGKPLLNNSCTLNCAWGGLISISFPGQVTVNNP